IHSSCCPPAELSTIYPKPETINCLKKIFNFHKIYLGLVKYAQNLMIYVNSETILKIDRFSLLIYGRVIHIWDILFLTITYILKAKRADNPQHKDNGLSALRLCVWLCDNCGIELFYADYYFPFALRTV